MRVLSAVVLALASAGVAFGDEREAPDRWAPGALDPAWATIAALQAWPSFGTEPPDWEAASGDPEPLVRAAAAAALGRGRFGQAARWLRPMLEDQSELVRSTALWALLQAPDESAREPLLFALASWERFDDDSAAPFGSPGALFRRAGLPADIVSLGKDERAEWLARFDRASWPPPPAPPTGPGRGPTWAMAAGGWLSAERSEWDADEGVDLELALTAPGRVELSYVGWRALKSLARDPQPRGGPTLRTFDGLVAVTAATPGARERLRLGGDPAILPGIYVLSRVGGGNPLFFRVRRSRAAEQALPALLEAAPHDLATVTRLGELRVKAAAPLLLRLWRQARSGAARRRAERQRAAMCGTVSDPESEVPFAALLGLESASAYAALLADGWPPLLEPEPEVWPAGLLEAGRGAATATLAGWRRLAGQANGAATLAAAASWPGVWRDPSAARAITEMAEAYCGSGLTSRDDVTWVTRNALEALAHFAPDQAAAFLVARLRRPPSAPLLVQQPAGRESPAYTSVLRRSFEALRHDTAVPAETRAALAAAAVTYEQLEDETSIPAEALEAWLQRAVTWSSPPARIDAVVRAARAALARQADPKAQVLLAELERRHGRWDEAIRLAREALPGVPADRRAFTRSVLAFALAAQGDALQAQQELTAAHAAKGWMAGEPDEARAWARNLVTRPLREGLRLRYERVSAAEIRGGSFFAQSAQRLRFAETPGSAGELTAVLPLPPRQIVALAPRRAAVLLDDGSVLAYDARAASPVWRATPRRVRRLVDLGPVLLAAGDGGVSALDPASGQELWRQADSLVECTVADGQSPGVLLSRLVPAERRIDDAGCSVPGEDLYVLSLHDALTGASRWTRPVARSPLACAREGGLLAFVDSAAGTGAIDAVSGRLLWQSPPAARRDGGADPLGTDAVAVALAPGSPPVFRSGTHLVARDRVSGVELWRYDWQPLDRGRDRPTLHLAAGDDGITYLVAARPGRDETRYVQVVEVSRLDAHGNLEQLPAPTSPDGRGGTLAEVRATPKGLALRRGSWDEFWEFGGAP